MATKWVEIRENQIAREVIDASIQIHRTLGPGLLESVYEGALTVELSQRGLGVIRQYPITVEYRGVALGEGYRTDMPVSGKVLLELKSGCCEMDRSTEWPSVNWAFYSTAERHS